MPFEPDAIAGSYDAMADDYASLFDGELERNPADREVLDRFIDLLPAPGPVCDLGCGPGHVAAYLSDRGIDAVGIDLSPRMVEVARRTHPGVRFEVGDIRALGADGRRWAGAVAYYSLIHLGRAELGDALRAVAEALVPGGVLAAIVHEGEGEIHVDEWRGRSVQLAATHFTEPEMQAALEQAGFTVRLLRTRPPYEWEYARPKLQVLAIAGTGTMG